MILELDCGNSCIKWRLLDPLQGASSSITAVSALAELPDELSVQRVRFVSVMTDEQTRTIKDHLHQRYGQEVAVARSSLHLGGVTNGYVEFDRLGSDRWLAVVAAFQLVQQDCLVIDIGTAITIDAVNHHGQHLGGFIVPGLGLLRTLLQTSTQRVRWTSGAECGAVEGFGTSTATAVEGGTLRMVQAFLRDQIQMAAEVLGGNYQIVVTGGDRDLFPAFPENIRVHIVPDLVFRGLAIACP